MDEKLAYILSQVWPMNQYDLINPTWKFIGFLVNMSPLLDQKHARMRNNVVLTIKPAILTFLYI
jgi:hypothetical protein